MSNLTGLSQFASHRFSPLRFDASHVIARDHVDALLDAARRAPSAGNSQPWAFIVGRRGDEMHRRLVPHLARSSSMWAPDASLLLANLAHLSVEGTDLEYSEFAHYDLGQAVAHLTFQADSLGLAVHQFRAFDRAAVAAEFDVPGHMEVTSMAAVGLPVGAIETHVGMGASRDRRSLDEVIWSRASS